MKKLFLLAGLLGCFSSVRAQKETGFAMSADLLLGYQSKTATAVIGYDFGYKPVRWLYIGAGPMVGASFGSGSSAFSAGGYGKIRFVAPLKQDKIAPFVDVRGGYSYGFSISSGNPIYGAGLGVRFARKYSVGLYCNISTSEYVEQETYTAYHTKKNPMTGKYQQYSYKATRDVTRKETNYTPALLLSIDF